jgi:hypothetical protein
MTIKYVTIFWGMGIYALTDRKNTTGEVCDEASVQPTVVVDHLLGNDRGICKYSKPSI